MLGRKAFHSGDIQKGSVDMGALILGIPDSWPPIIKTKHMEPYYFPVKGFFDENMGFAAAFNTINLILKKITKKYSSFSQTHFLSFLFKSANNFYIKFKLFMCPTNCRTLVCGEIHVLALINIINTWDLIKSVKLLLTPTINESA